MKASIEHFAKKAKQAIPSLPPHVSLIKVLHNRHPPFTGEALEYVKEFNKKY